MKLVIYMTFAGVEGKPKLDARFVAGTSNGNTWPGHLQEAPMLPTFDVIISEAPENWSRRIDPKPGVALTRF
jgi:predicted DNA-binding protein with PD1-like motif